MFFAAYALVIPFGWKESSSTAIISKSHRLALASLPA
jgi:hypothetical protein